MIIKAIVFAVIIFLGSLSVVEAQVFVNGGAPGQFTVLGWNYGHIVNCYTQVDGSTTWFYALIQEGGFGFTNNPAFVTNLNPFPWSQVVTFTFK